MDFHSAVAACFYAANMECDDKIPAAVVRLKAAAADYEAAAGRVYIYLRETMGSEYTRERSEEMDHVRRCLNSIPEQVELTMLLLRQDINAPPQGEW